MICGLVPSPDSRMLTEGVVGTAIALCGGCGNLGGGATQHVMGSALFPLNVIYYVESEKAWHTVAIVPGFVAMISGIWTVKPSDDAPTGIYADLKKHDSMPYVYASASFRQGA